jgi:glycosyltransferase involved in cell wall biosynthesis
VRYGLHNRVTFTGAVRQIEAYYAIAELVVLPSLYEGMPLVALEAGAAGRPVVATAVDGTREVVQHGQTGLLVPPRDPEALARAASELLADAPRARRMGLAAQQRVSQHFSLDNQIHLTEQVFHACLSGTSAT